MLKNITADKVNNKMTRLIITLLILTSLKGVVHAQEIVTDRPDQTESSSTIPHKSIQIEMGFGSGKYDHERLTLLPTTLLRYGLSRNVELRFVEQLANFDNESTSTSEFGLSDIELGLKLKILEKEDVNAKIALISHLIIPTGSSELTNTNFGTINKLAFSHEINNFLDLGYNLGYNYFGTGNGDLTYSLVLGIGLSDKIGMYVETFGEYSDFAEITPNVDSGLTYLVKENLQLDFSFGLGLIRKMNYFSLGFSWNINFNHHNNK